MQLTTVQLYAVSVILCFVFGNPFVQQELSEATFPLLFQLINHTTEAHTSAGIVPKQNGIIDFATSLLLTSLWLPKRTFAPLTSTSSFLEYTQWQTIIIIHK